MTDDTIDVKFERTPRGEVAILPRAQYERLVARANEASEDAGTARLVDRALDEIAAGSPTIPKVVVDRLANGDSPLRVLREWRDETQLHLAFKTGISQSHISDIEIGRRTGTSATLRKLADALGVPLDLLA
jgi:hypothetical protein